MLLGCKVFILNTAGAGTNRYERELSWPHLRSNKPL